MVIFGYYYHIFKRGENPAYDGNSPLDLGQWQKPAILSLFSGVASLSLVWFSVVKSFSLILAYQNNISKDSVSSETYQGISGEIKGLKH